MVLLVQLDGLEQKLAFCVLALKKESKEQQEIKRLKAELKCMTDERDILKKAAAYFARESE
jgi:transposase-like protein